MFNQTIQKKQKNNWSKYYKIKFFVLHTINNNNKNINN